LAPEHVNLTKDDLSPYSKFVHTALKGDVNYKDTKLTATFNTRRKYVIHGLNLQTYLRLGMRLLKIHRVIAFQQSDFLTTYLFNIYFFLQYINILLFFQGI